MVNCIHCNFTCSQKCNLVKHTCYVRRIVVDGIAQIIKEKQVSDHYYDKYTTEGLNPRRQTRCTGGYLDLTTDHEIIEIKLFSKFRLAIGQLISYHIGNENKNMVLILFGTIPTTRQLAHIQAVCSSVSIELRCYNS
jgi:hypothetical protein